MCTHMRMHIRETYLCRADARSVNVYAQSSAAEQKNVAADKICKERRQATRLYPHYRRER